MAQPAIGALNVRGPNKRAIWLLQSSRRIILFIRRVIAHDRRIGAERGVDPLYRIDIRQAPLCHAAYLDVVARRPDRGLWRTGARDGAGARWGSC